jgi:hypothetical protein
MLTETKSKLADLICGQISQPASPAIHVLADSLLGTYEKTVLAILFYGSCLRTGTDLGGLVDLYVIVDSYPAAFPKSIMSALFPWTISTAAHRNAGFILTSGAALPNRLAYCMRATNGLPGRFNRL